MKNLDFSVSNILYFKIFYNFRMQRIVLGEFPDPKMFIHSLNDQVKMFTWGFKYVVGFQA